MRSEAAMPLEKQATIMRNSLDIAEDECFG
jgi:hypothetical protein